MLIKIGSALGITRKLRNENGLRIKALIEEKSGTGIVSAIYSMSTLRSPECRKKVATGWRSKYLASVSPMICGNGDKA